MELPARKAHTLVKPILIVVALALFSGALVACAAFRDLRSRASLLAESFTGMKCDVTSIGPCFPWGIRATGITLSSTSGEALFQAKELRAQVSLLRYIQKKRKRSELFDTLHGDQVKLTFTRDERGFWSSPLVVPSSKDAQSSPGEKAVHRRFIFTNVSIQVRTGAGMSERFYKKVEADMDPGSREVTLKLWAMNGTATIKTTKGAVRRYELQADDFPVALLVPLPATPLPLENIALSGSLSATTRDHENFAVEGSGTIATRNLRYPVISSRTIDDLNLPFDLKCDVNSSGLENLMARINLAGATTVIQGDVQGWEKPVIDVTATFIDFSYDRAISALPPSLHPSLPEIRVSGSMTGTFRMHLDMADPDSLDYSYTGRTDRLEILNLGKVIDIERLKGPFLHKVRMDPDKEISILLSPSEPDFTPYRKIPFSLRSAVLAAEDLGFFSHRGFSTNNIRRSFIQNLKAGRVVRGASTISMQLAKNLFLSPERTLSRKLEEALITLALEQDLDKKRIMEIYLNIIEWGNGIYGIGPAARYYFGKTPAELSPVESAFLASIIARPKNWRPDPLSRLRPGWRGYLRIILYRMYEMGAADTDDLLAAGVSEATIASLREEEIDDPGDTGYVPPQDLPPVPPFPF